MFMIKWDEPHYPAGIIINYSISITVLENNMQLTLTVNSSTLQAFTSFEFFEIYNISVTPVNGFGQGETTTIVMVASPEGVFSSV